MFSNAAAMCTRVFRMMCALGVFFLLTGCRVVIVSGPSTVTVGDTVTFVLDLSSVTGGQVTQPTLFLYADVPTGWNPVSNSYAGTIDGAMVSGTASLVADPTSCDPGDLPTGFQRLVYAAEFAGTSSATDIGTATLEFSVVDQPAGSYDVTFVFGSSGPTSNCSVSTVQTINRTASPLREFREWIDSLGNGNPALFDDPEALVLSPDGQYAYASFSRTDAIVAFARNRSTGELTYLESQVDGQGEVDGLVGIGPLALSPDSLHLYGRSGSDQAVSIFEREPSTGALTFVDNVTAVGLDGTAGLNSLAMAPDGQHLSLVWLGDFGIRTFARNAMDGTLTLAQDLPPVENRGEGPSAGGNSLAYAPDGLHMYATSLGSGSIRTYSRDSGTGVLTFVEELSASTGTAELAGALNPTVSPDGSQVYVVTSTKVGGDLVVLDRDSITGQLTLSQTFTDGVSGVSGMSQPLGVVASDDEVTVSSRSGIAVFQRAGDGTLTFLESYRPGLQPLIRPVTSSDGRSLYAVLDESTGGILRFESPQPLFSDGFESGNASAWSTVPAIP